MSAFLLFPAGVLHSAESRIRVGILKGLGDEQIASVLNRQQDMTASLMRDVDPAILGQYDVLIVAQSTTPAQIIHAKGMLHDWVVHGGGGMCFIHDAVGYRKHPIVFRDEMGGGIDNPTGATVKVVAEHLVTKGLKIGQQFNPGFQYDQIAIRTSNNSLALVANDKGQAVVVAGPAGKGRVVLDGMLTGWAGAPEDLSGKPHAPEGKELQILVNAVRWLAGGEKTDFKQPKVKTVSETQAPVSSKRVKTGAETIITTRGVCHFAGMDVNEIKPVAGKSGRELPPQLIMPPGLYSFDGKVYELKAEGLYRFARMPDYVVVQRVVYERNLDAFLSAICWMVCHGDKDSWKPAEYLDAQALTRKLAMTCGNITGWAIHLLKRIDYDVRRVDFHTDGEICGDDGHVMLEIYLPAAKKWALHDLDCNVIPKKDGRYLTAMEFSDMVRDGVPYDLEHIANDVNADITAVNNKGVNFNGIYEAWFSNDTRLRKWYRRVAPVLRIEGYFYVAEARYLQENYFHIQYLERELFENMFYAPDSDTMWRLRGAK